MRIVSLLPSLTELLCALGHRESLVGVTHECDYPADVGELPRLTRSRISPTSTDSLQIDQMVTEQGGSLYELNRELLESLEPDLILTQTQCDVCAVNEAQVRSIAAECRTAAHVESVNPTSLEGVFEVFRRVGELLNSSTEAEDLIDRYRATKDEVRRRRSSRTRPTVVHLEWTDPLYRSGHWNPEIIHDAGGEELIAESGQASGRMTWESLVSADPEVLIIAPCGFDLERTRHELAHLSERPGWDQLRAVRSGLVSLVDGSAYFSRPGPRLEASLRIAAAAIDPDSCSELAPIDGWERLMVSI